MTGFRQDFERAERVLRRDNAPRRPLSPAEKELAAVSAANRRVLDGYSTEADRRLLARLGPAYGLKLPVTRWPEA